jgi:hypothetical protein
MKLSGTLPAGEALIAGAALSRRLFGWRRFGFWIYMAILVATATTWFALPGTVGLDESLAGLGFGISVMLIMYGYVRWCRGLGSKGWARLGAFPQIDQSYEAGDSGLELVSGNGITTTLPWPALLEIGREKTQWLLITTSGGAFYLPRRFFTDAAQERSFVTLCLERMSPDARARSGEATAFIAKA